MKKVYILIANTKFMHKTYIIILSCYLLYNNINVYGVENTDTKQLEKPLNYEVNKRATLVIAEDDDTLENYFFFEKTDNDIIYDFLIKILNDPNFLLPNTNWWLIKIFFMAIIPLSASVNNLGITTHDDITAGLILVTQFTIPLNILNVCFLLDKLKIYYKQGIKNTITVFKQNIAKMIYYLVNISVSIYLAYLSSLIDTQTSGNAYSWIFSKATDSKTTLDMAYDLGYTLNLLCVLALNSVFFFNLISEIFHKTGIGYLLNVSPSLKYDTKSLFYYQHINNLKQIIYYTNEENAIKKSIEYLANNNLNTILDIANLQLHCTEENYHEKSTNNIYINLFKFCFILTMAVFCAEAFRQIFSSKLLLKDFIEHYSNNTADGGYSFLLDNKQIFTCDNLDHCINDIDINSIDISTAEINHILSLNQNGIIANALKGIAVSTNAATMIIMLADYFWKIKNKKMFRKTIVASYFKAKNIIPTMAAGSLWISGYYYMKNIYNVSAIAEKGNDLLYKAGKVTFVPVTASLALAISSIGFTCSRGMSFLINATRFIKYKIYSLTK